MEEEVEIKARVPSEVRAAFKAKLALRGVTATDAIADFVMRTIAGDNADAPTTPDRTGESPPEVGTVELRCRKENLTAHRYLEALMNSPMRRTMVPLLDRLLNGPPKDLE